MARSIDKEREAIRKDLEKLKNDFIKLSKSSVDLAEDKALEARQKLEAEFERLIARVQGGAEAMLEQGQELVKGVSEEVEKHPLSALLTSFGLGMLVGWLLTRK